MRKEKQYHVRWKDFHAGCRAVSRFRVANTNASRHVIKDHAILRYANSRVLSSVNGAATRAAPLATTAPAPPTRHAADPSPPPAHAADEHCSDRALKTNESLTK